MHIGQENYYVGNDAMGSVLRLYYHLLKDGGITFEQEVLGSILFDPYAFLEVEVDPGYEDFIDQALLREGAVIHLLCRFSDIIDDCDDEYLLHPITQKILDAYATGQMAAIPECDELFGILEPYGMGSQRYRICLDGIYRKYVLGRFGRLVCPETS